MLLDQDNYARGFLVDEELMGGVSPDPENSEVFIAFVLRHTTGEYLGHRSFSALSDALAAVNQVQRNWHYEKSSGCGGCSGKGGATCTGGKCGKKTVTDEAAGSCAAGACPI